MKQITISIPEKYAEGLNPILRTLMNLLQVFGIAVSIVINGQTDPYEIMLQESPDLDARFAEVIQNAIDLINSEFIHSKKDPWQTQALLEENLRKNLEAIDRGLEA